MDEEQKRDKSDSLITKEQEATESLQTQQHSPALSYVPQVPQGAG